MRRGIPEARGIRLLDTGDRRRLLAIVRDDDREFVARILSDGTLRFLALLALAYAPQPPGLICFEEPENGVHPGRLQFVVDTLRGISERGQEGGYRPQVIVNSHSPYLVDLLDPSEMLTASITEKGQTSFHLGLTAGLIPRSLLRETISSLADVNAPAKVKVSVPPDTPQQAAGKIHFQLATAPTWRINRGTMRFVVFYPVTFK